MGLWGIGMACYVILDWARLNTPLTHYTWDFGVLGWFVSLPDIFSDWAQYPVYPLYVTLWGIGVVCFVILIGPKMRQSVVLCVFYVYFVPSL